MTINEKTRVAPGSPEGSEGRSGVMGDIFGDAETAPQEEAVTETPAEDVSDGEAHDTKTGEEEVVAEEAAETGERETVQKTEEEAAPESEEEVVEEYSEEAYKKAYDDVLEQSKLLKKGLAEVEEQKKGMERKFTEQSEQFAALRKDAGLDEAHGDDKVIRKTAEKMGETPPPVEFTQKNYLPDKTLDTLVERKIITKEQVPLVKSLAPVLNVLVNGVAYNLTEQFNTALGDVRGEVQPFVMGQEVRDQLTDRFTKWGKYLATYSEKYGKPSKEQGAALMTEWKEDGAFFNMVDDATPERVETAMRRFFHDPGGDKLSSFADPPPPKKKAATQVKIVETEPDAADKAASEKGSSSWLKRQTSKIFGDQ